MKSYHGREICFPVAIVKQFAQSQLVQTHVKIHAREKYFLVIVEIESFHNNNS